MDRAAKQNGSADMHRTAEPARETIEALPLRAQAVFRALLYHRGKNTVCWPRQELLAEEVGISVRQIQKWLAYLAEAGVIEIERTNMRSCNRYYIPPRDTNKRAPHDTNFSSGHEANKSAPHDTNFSSGLAVAPLDELNSIERGSIEGAPPPSACAAEIQTPPDADEHPEVKLLLDGIRALEAMAAEERSWLEAWMRKEEPLVASDPQSFRMACAREALRRQRVEAEFEGGWAEFVKAFVRDVPGCPKSDLGFLERVKSLFANPGPFNARGVGAIPAEMQLALECFLFDKRRKNEKWGFAREAYQFLPVYIISHRKQIINERARAAHVAREAAKGIERQDGDAATTLFADSAEAQKTSTVPSAPDVECAQITEALCELLGNERAFDGPTFFNTRFERAADGSIQLVAMNGFQRDLIESKFRMQIRQAVEQVTGSRQCEVVVGQVNAGKP